MSEAAALQFLGFGARAGYLVYGQAKCLDAVRRRKIDLLLLDGGVSQGTLKTFENACRTHDVPLARLEGEDVLGRSVGRPDCRIVGVADADFARKMIEKFGIISGRGAD